jgi:hypothetical protein
MCAAGVLALAALAGCGGAPKPVAISGTVTHGGEKMTWPEGGGGSLLVIFMPADPADTARYSARETDLATSSYKIAAIPPGRYKVAVQQFYPSAKTNFNDTLDGRYDPGHTDLTAEVTHDGQVVNIDVPKAAKGTAGEGEGGRKKGKPKDDTKGD